MRNKDELGKRGEALAARYLEDAGLRIIDRNWRCTLGEIDLVAVDGATLVVVEVKTRSSEAYGHPLEAITPGKLERLYLLASRWARAHDLRFSGFRVDAVAIVDGGAGQPVIEHLRAVS
ncbi:YraN family protein [Arthrobacter tumbae]|uniref:YraN family protein n=1 Tax=Arthrobacter tumbae TaxID=163874 RepID=UPI001959C80E|nr:YraN family protein [Arthrobacter tumbae]MBM7779848.1 putative endonuclease [Arthrobacter tumbae]